MQHNKKILGICYTNNISRFDTLPYDLDIFTLNKELDKFPVYKNYSKNKFFYTFKNAKLNLFTKLLHGVNLFFKIIRLVLSEKYDCFIFITPPYFHFLLYPILRFFKKNTVTIVADAYYHITKDKSFDNYLLYVLRRILFPIYFMQEYLSIRFSSAVFTNSFFLYEVHKKWNKNTFYTPNGADVKTIVASDIKKYCKCDYIIYIGSFSPFRGVELLIEAFKLLKISYKKPIKLVLMGNYGEQEKFLRNLAKNEKDIIFAGFVPIPEMYSYVKAAKIGVIPNYNTITSQTISSNKGFIYIAAEIPQVVTDSGDHAHWTNKLKTGLITKPIIEDISSNMMKLLTDKRVYNELRKNCINKRQLVDYPTVKIPLINYLNELNKSKIKWQMKTN